MLAEMAPHHLGEWLAYHRIDPWGEYRADLRMGIHASVLANVNRDASKKPEPFRPVDFMPNFDPVADQQNLTARAKAVFFALPGRRTKKE